MKDIFHFESCTTDPVSSLYKFHTTVNVLRIDKIHPDISGNKWFKLKHYIEEVKNSTRGSLVTFGGAFSNHIVATAAAAQLNDIKSIGIIRGEKPNELSHTLKKAISFGMQLFFVSREEYKQKRLPPELMNKYDENELYIINEGGYGIKGMAGASEILKLVNIQEYTHIVAAVGTGTMLAGIVSGSYQNKITGIPVLKNHFKLTDDINSLLPAEKKNQFELIHDYHFGGYAKHKPALIDFMNEWFRKTGIPSDFVYTGKLFYAVNDLLKNSYFPSDSRILIIHSGGLRGNESLMKGTLIF